MKTIIYIDGETKHQDLYNAHYVIKIFGNDFVYLKKYDRSDRSHVYPLKDLPAHIIMNEGSPEQFTKLTKFDAVWGTYGKSGEEPLTFKRLIDLESDHLQAIARTQCISLEYRNIIVEILKDRKVLP